jgi:transposase
MNYSSRIYPDANQQAIMIEWLERCQRLYNRCLCDLKDWIHSRKFSLSSCSLDREYIVSADIPFPNYLEQKRQLTQWKKKDSYLQKVHSQVTQFAKVDHKNSSQICPNCGTHTGKKPLSPRVHSCSECGHQTTRDRAVAQVLLQRGLDLISSTEGQSGKEIACQVLLSGVSCPDKWRGAGRLDRVSAAVRSTVEKPTPLYESV